MTVPFLLPELGENIKGGDVTRVLVKEGDRIEPGATVVEVETDKALVEVPCPTGGTVRKVLVKEGDHVDVGGTLFMIEQEGAVVCAEPTKLEPPAPRSTQPPRKTDAPKEPPLAQSETEAEPTAVKPAPAAVKPAAKPARAASEAPAGPAVRRLARELGVDLSNVTGSGTEGRITEDDVKRHARERMERPASQGAAEPAAPPLPDFSKWGPVERKPFRFVRAHTAEHLMDGWRLTPQVTQFEIVDATELEAFRKRNTAEAQSRGGKLTMTVLAIRAVTSALAKFPECNASLDLAAGELVVKKYVHVGIAVDTDRGLLVPVIRDADKKDIFALSAELTKLADRAREGKLALDEMRGGTFTISNLGGIAGTAFTPIVNYPEVAILGLGRARWEAQVRGERIEPRLMMSLCLSYDHRVIDGAAGARFVRSVADSMRDPERLILGL